jgi:hypothetical protein
MVDGLMPSEETEMGTGVQTGTRRDGVGIRVCLAVCGAALVLLIAMAAAGADRAGAWAGINTLSVETSSTQAGGHPNVDAYSLFDTVITKGLEPDGTPHVEPPLPGTCGCDDPRVIIDHFPTGFIGDPHAVPICQLEELGKEECAVESQVGVVVIYTALFTGQVPLFNLAPHPDEAGLVGFEVPLSNNTVFISLSARTESDYGLDATATPIFHVLPLYGVDLHLFGVPADPKNDVHRFPSPLTGLQACFDKWPANCYEKESAAPRVPYLQNPTTCGAPLTFGETIQYYDGTVVHADTPWPETTGCDQLDFNPNLTAHPTTEQADTASGMDVELNVPQAQSPTVPSPSELRATTVTLPEGFSINPNAADGKRSCSDTEASFGTKRAAVCPEAAKVGTLEISSSALPGPIDGGIYLGEPRPGNRYRLFLTADGFATHLKLAGVAMPDPDTGRITVSFSDLPQSPLQRFSMHFFGSERGLLATPEQCGTYAVDSEFVPWDAALATQNSTSFFTLSSGPEGAPCPGARRPFNPHLTAGSAENTAGAHSSFGLLLSRDDGDQNLDGVTVRTPPGFAATLRGIPYCSDASLAAAAAATYTGLAELTSPSCPAASQIGTSVTGAGAGSHPLYLSGRVYLAGPYHGAPLSIAVVTQAVSGPYDLGNVVVRAAISVNPITAGVTAASDPLPQIVGGIPLRLRTIRVDLDRPSFALNPTSCRRLSVDTTVFGDQGGVASPSAFYQAANCGDLPYGPKLSLKLKGGLKRRGHPAIHAVFSTKPGEANTRRVSVALPKGELLDNSHIGTVCTRPDFAKDACPAASQLGTAEATTPLLDAPLRGNVYLRSSPAHKLPDLVMDLEGQFDIELAGRIDTAKNGALRTNFDAVPDAPVTSFVLDLVGGSKGLLTNSEDICDAGKKATVKMTGQNGVVTNRKVSLQSACGGQQSPKRHGRRHARAGW